MQGCVSRATETVNRLVREQLTVSPSFPFGLSIGPDGRREREWEAAGRAVVSTVLSVLVNAPVKAWGTWRQAGQSA